MEFHHPLAPGVKPTFRLLDPFSGAEGLPTFRWLRRNYSIISIHCQLGSPAYASEFIIAIKFFLTGEAAEWAKDNLLIQARITTQSPTNDGVQAIKQLIQDRFPQHFCEAHTFDINAKFGDLHQRLEETLLTHYKRASSMTKHVGVGDRKTGISLLLVEIAFLDGIIRSFVKSINQLFIRKRGCQEIELTSKIILLGAFYWRGSRTNKGSNRQTSR